MYLETLVLPLNPNPERKIKMQNPKDNALFAEVLEWVGCPFLFNHEFTDDEAARIWNTVCEQHPQVAANPTKFRLSGIVYNIVEEMGFTLSDM